MNIYLLEQNDRTGWDTYDSCVVNAYTEENARKIRPASHTDYSSWPLDTTNVKVTLIGKALKTINKEGVVLSSFNAG